MPSEQHVLSLSTNDAQFLVFCCLLGYTMLHRQREAATKALDQLTVLHNMDRSSCARVGEALAQLDDSVGAALQKQVEALSDKGDPIALQILRALGLKKPATGG